GRAPPARTRIEVSFPALSRFASGNGGIRHVWTFAESRPGPHVVLQALTHGNEVCGAIALDRLLREGIRPMRGTLSIVFANVDAYLRFDSARPFASRCIDEDFNRLWTTDVLDCPLDSSGVQRAREWRPLSERTHFLLDILSMSEPGLPLAMAGRRRNGVA